MVTILGIDPGSLYTGFAIIESDGVRHKYIESGRINLPNKDFALRLNKIYSGIHDIIMQYNPTWAAIEQVFVHINPASALKLGHARGAAVVAVANNNVKLAEYSPRVIKQSVVGSGSASKSQVQYMVKTILQIKDITMTADAADAVAVALCHAHNLNKRY